MRFPDEVSPLSPSSGPPGRTWNGDGDLSVAPNPCTHRVSVVVAAVVVVRVADAEIESFAGRSAAGTAL